jgi:phospholipase/carboxylesterase
MLHGGRALVLCPQGPVAVPFGGGQYGYGWFPLRMGEATDVEAFRHASDLLRDFIRQAVVRYPIEPERIVLAGFSQGGMMAYDLGLREPARFAGLAALSSWFPPQLVEDLPKLPEHEGFPVLVVHGTRDNRIEIERARESRESLRPYGVVLTYREFDMGHEIRQDALKVVLQWLDDKALKAKE